MMIDKDLYIDPKAVTYMCGPELIEETINKPGSISKERYWQLSFITDSVKHCLTAEELHPVENSPAYHRLNEIKNDILKANKRLR